MVGPLRIEAINDSFVIGSLVKIAVQFSAPPKALAIWSIEAFIDELAEWKSPRKRSLDFTFADHHERFLALKGERNLPLQTVEAEVEWRTESLTRLPDDHHISPTSSRQTQGPLTVYHTMSFEIIFSILPNLAQRKSIRIAKPIELAMVCMPYPTELPIGLTLTPVYPHPRKPRAADV